ncbi:MAG: thioredoxin-dependent thiol peroxidase [Nitrospinae bacterium]|nr:thioredoxin-dependent thiol peroxidase [Nitrospinota bacterium]
MNLLDVGTKAPNFTVVDQNDRHVSLSDFMGKKVILYFYPKDNTPGCTKEACGFRDTYDTLRQLNVEILGVSIDDKKSHGSFAQKFSLPFTLLADTDKQIVEAYRAWGEKALYGKKYMGTNRVTYLIDESGYIAAVFAKVKPEKHAEEILAFLHAQGK